MKDTKSTKESEDVVVDAIDKLGGITKLIVAFNIPLCFILRVLRALRGEFFLSLKTRCAHRSLQLYPPLDCTAEGDLVGEF